MAVHTGLIPSTIILHMVHNYLSSILLFSLPYALCRKDGRDLVEMEARESDHNYLDLPRNMMPSGG